PERTPPADRGGVSGLGSAQIGAAGPGALRRRQRSDRRVSKGGQGWANPCLLLFAGWLFRRLRRPRPPDEHRHRLPARRHDLHAERNLGRGAGRGKPGRRQGRTDGPDRRRVRADPCARRSHPERDRPEPRPGHPGGASRAGGHGRRPGSAPARAGDRTQGARGMSAPAAAIRSGRWAAFQGQLRDRPALVLVGVLLVLVVVIGVTRPGTVGPTWVANTILFAAPLGIVAAGQTLVMLTAGIDLSVASVMTAAAYVAASQSYFGSIRAVLLALAVAIDGGLLNGIGVAIFRVQPLIMTLGMSLVV